MSPHAEATGGHVSVSLLSSSHVSQCKLTWIFLCLFIFLNFTFTFPAGPGALSRPAAAPAGGAEGGGEEGRSCWCHPWGAGDRKGLAGEGEEGGGGGEQGGLDDLSAWTRDVAFLY